jgi:hypothetical protein
MRCQCTRCTCSNKKPPGQRTGRVCTYEQLHQSLNVEGVDVDWPLMNTWLSSCRSGEGSLMTNVESAGQRLSSLVTVNRVRPQSSARALWVRLSSASENRQPWLLTLQNDTPIQVSRASRPAETKRDALALKIPGGCAHIALVQAPAHPFGKDVLGMEGELKGTFQKRGGLGVGGPGGWKWFRDKGARRHIRGQGTMGGRPVSHVCT